MRDILFRAKKIKDNEWIEGYFAVHPKGNCSISMILDKCKNPPDSDPMWERVLISHEVDPLTICQYTGLTDKNGNKIFENDIVKKEFYTDYEAFANSEEYVGVVKVEDCAWIIETKRDNHICYRPIFEAMAYSKDVEYFDVIGNIFDNPELLKTNR